MKQAVASLALLSAICLLVGCYSERMYEGDGILVDKGLFALYGRYDLHLGKVSLSESGEYVFRASKLPREKFATGFKVQSLPKDEEYNSVFVHLQIRNEKHEIVVDEAGPLSEWVWGHALGGSESFVYRRGNLQDVQISGGMFKPTAIGAKADNGHGSYFKPRPRGQYLVLIKVDVVGTRQPEMVDFMFSGVGA